MTHRQRLLAVLRGEPYDRLPVVHFGFLEATLRLWRDQGHLTDDEYHAALAGDGSAGEAVVASRLGFDHNYHTIFAPHGGLRPGFEPRVVEELPGGYRKVLTGNGAIQLQHPDNQSIPAEVDHLLKTRADWEQQFLPKLVWSAERVTHCGLRIPSATLDNIGAKAYLADPDHEFPVLLHAGSLFGAVRDLLGVEGMSYLQVDDPGLFAEIIDTLADISYRNVELALQLGFVGDVGHFWEDICFKTGPLVNPRVFRERVGPHYQRITSLMASYGIDLVSLDCDGQIDTLLPIWLDNGVNVMFPIEVGTWDAHLTPWREQYGDRVKGVGGTNKKVFAQDYAAVDAEVERLRRIVDLGGYLPCPDHRLPHDNKWENVQYYCDRMRAVLGG